MCGAFGPFDSPVSNNGRGLKREAHYAYRLASDDSPVSNNGRGLKRCASCHRRTATLIRPLAITGVD